MLHPCNVMWYEMCHVLLMSDTKFEVTALMCCIGKVGRGSSFLTWYVRLPPRGPGWDLSFDKC